MPNVLKNDLTSSTFILTDLSPYFNRDLYLGKAPLMWITGSSVKSFYFK